MDLETARPEGPLGAAAPPEPDTPARPDTPAEPDTPPEKLQKLGAVLRELIQEEVRAIGSQKPPEPPKWSWIRPAITAMVIAVDLALVVFLVRELLGPATRRLTEFIVTFVPALLGVLLVTYTDNVRTAIRECSRHLATTLAASLVLVVIGIPLVWRYQVPFHPIGGATLQRADSTEILENPVPFEGLGEYMIRVVDTENERSREFLVHLARCDLLRAEFRALVPFCRDIYPLEVSALYEVRLDTDPDVRSVTVSGRFPAAFLRELKGARVRTTDGGESVVTFDIRSDRFVNLPPGRFQLKVEYRGCEVTDTTDVPARGTGRVKLTCIEPVPDTPT